MKGFAQQLDARPPTSRRRIVAALAVFAVAVLTLLGTLPHKVEAQGAQVVLLHLHDTIQPISSGYLARGLARAAETHATAVVVEIDTPGGLLESTREMVHRILASPVPVILYVAPAGSRAASAGFFLLEAADLAAMAPGTNTGAAHPVVEGAQLDATMRQKLENDTTAFLRSYTARRNRNTSAAEEAVLHSKSYTEREALELHLIDAIAADTTELLNQLDGRTITRFDGKQLTLHTRGAAISALEPTLRERILGRLMNPNFAVLILVVGGLLIYLEFNTPGTVVPGAVGSLLVLTSLFALNLLPVHYTAVMLLAAAFLLMLLEAKFPSHGVLGGLGILSLIVGALTLVDGPIPELRVHIATAVAAGLSFGLITVFLVRLAVKARHQKALLGPEAMIGEMAVVQTAIGAAGSGQILVRGELWNAESPSPAQPGEWVRVRSVRNLTLLVERIPGDAKPST